MSARKADLSFLTLPPEIRNRIYTFATYPTTGEESFVAPCIALVCTCRQIYEEYRPISLKAEVTIPWRDVPRYFQKYFTDKNGAFTHIVLAPARMTIITNACLREGKPVEIDLLPILKFRLANENFECEFVRCGDEKSNACVCAHGAAEVTRDDMKTLLAADVTTLRKLLTHGDESWVKDIKEGRIQKLVATHIGTNCCPKLKFYLGHGERGSFSPEFKTIAEDAGNAQVAADSGPQRMATSHWIHAFSRAFDDYLNRIKLQTAFMDNQYKFLSEFIWSTDEAVRLERL
ncbi:hypothetical protein E8E12_004568 [Didymella heteroderae]|uniref:Uncharacterized protein n=1 Tax=Didymella heteroderae TaxID=1769908 RepID=A0A9P5BWT4_9PLEO|nr:hypothetical protein E8E12_004568 [Didymella heteroderae]